MWLWISLLLSCRTKDLGDTAITVDRDADGFEEALDCDDENPEVHPEAIEVPYDGIDNDCAPETPDDDLDGDGWALADDCDDLDATVHPDAIEVCNEADDDCDGEIDDAVGDAWYLDSDGDGFGDPDSATQSCEQSNGYVADNSDCDDADSGIHIAADEICDLVDNDCDGQIDEPTAVDAQDWYADKDDDGWGSETVTRACDAPSGYVDNDEDCDDGAPLVHPDGVEICNGIDDDCDGRTDPDDSDDASTWYADADADGYGADYSTQACEMPSGYASTNDDCDDGAKSTNPGASETCDEADNDCDTAVDEGVLTSWYLDYDTDGYGDDTTVVEACQAPTSVYVAIGGDCDDTSTAYSPAATPGCDGDDYDCDGSVDNDADGDGYADSSCGGDDCDDTQSSIKPDNSGDCALGTSCDDILTKGYSTGDSDYSIDPDGYSTGVDPEMVWCDMTTEGGGWTLIAANSTGSGLNTTNILDDSTLGSPDLISDYKAQAWSSMPMADLMFDDGSTYAVYEGVDDGSQSYYDFQAAIPHHNCASSSGYTFAMTAGNLSGGQLCSTQLMIHPYDEDGGQNSSCSSSWAWADDASGPTWSTYNNNGCPMDDPSSTNFVYNGGRVPFDTMQTLLMYAR